MNFGQRLRQQRLTDAGWAGEQEEPVGRFGSFRPLRLRRTALQIA
jgi:hypothetical protein